MTAQYDITKARKAGYTEPPMRVLRKLGFLTLEEYVKGNKLDEQYEDGTILFVFVLNEPHDLPDFVTVSGREHLEPIKPIKALLPY